MDYETKSLKAQMKKADRLNAKRVLIVGEDELTRGKVLLRDMETKEQKDIPVEGLVRNLVKTISQQQID